MDFSIYLFNLMLHQKVNISANFNVKNKDAKGD